MLARSQKQGAAETASVAAEDVDDRAMVKFSLDHVREGCMPDPF